MTFDDKPPVISCPRGTFAVYDQDDCIVVVLIDMFNSETARTIVDSVNRVLETDRSRSWCYCIYVGDKTVTSQDAEKKFRQFISFRRWLSSTLDKSCKIAVVFEDTIASSNKNQIQKIFCDADVAFKRFPSIESALGWLRSDNEYLE